MKIGLLSMQRVKNYGSVLQAYSLKKMVEDITGEEARFIDPVYDDFYLANMPIVDGDDYEGKSDYSVNIIHRYYRRIKNHLINKHFDNEIFKFQNEYLKVNYDNRNEKYDLVIEGSDEVFKCTREIYKDLYGSNKNGKRMITYAASCGSADIRGFDEETITALRKDMSNFSAMSVRDDNTYTFIKKLYDGPIEMHMDPVLMGDLNQRKHEPVNEKKYILVYGYPYRIRNKDEIEAVKSFAKKNDLKTIALGAPQIWCDKYVAVSPFKLLDYFSNASFVVTDTFHGTIFSVINHVKFVSIVRKTNKNKMTALLSQLGLVDRVFTSPDNLEDILNKEIDYEKVDKIIADQKERTLEYLKCQIANS